MYKKEFKIIFNEEDNRIKQGEYFEDIVAKILKSQRYIVKQRVNFTGMEIDLIAKHNDRNNEEIYVECKAKEKLSSNDIKSFVFNTTFKKMHYGYFISTVEFGHQVAGLIDEIENNSEYKNLYFFGPEKIIEFLEESNEIVKDNNKNFTESVAKMILSHTYFGVYKLYLFSGGTFSTKFCVTNSCNEIVNDLDIITKLQSYIPEISDLEFVDYSNEEELEKLNSANISNFEATMLETVAEVKRSEEWFDYLPTSSKHFIGRKDILMKYEEFIESIKSKKSDKRVFYIEGKSGWGKSSLVSAIRDKSKTKKFRNSEFIFAVDTRSASTNNFIALAFRKMIESASDEGFLGSGHSKNQINILSSYDILGSESIKTLFQFLEENNKYLILIFDQFEDIFRKESIFKVFYKFLLDINNFRTNIIVGFSWKSEIAVPIQHEAYHLWQVLKSETFSIDMREFDSKEVNGVINQLQNSIEFKLDSNIKRRIMESSQGFPWLTKKLCIHTFNEFSKNVSIDELLEQELNIKTLFDKDLETVNVNELKALRYIAKRAFDGNMFDATEIDEVIDNITLTSLINKRLVIRSGAKYNIYWDIFRDYLVSNEIPLIGESYILRIRPSVCFEVFSDFQINESIEFEELRHRYVGRYTDKTLYNILRQLLDIGLLTKEETAYRVNKNIESVDKTEFIDYLSKKFERYTPYLKLVSSTDEVNSIQQILLILQDTFKGVELRNSTWEIYTKTFISWISYIGLKGIEDIEMYSFDTILSNKLPSRKSKNQMLTFTPQKPIRDDIEVFLEVINNKDKIDIKSKNKFLYDLSAIGVLHYWKDDVILTKIGIQLSMIKSKDELLSAFSNLASNMDKIKRAIELITDNNITNIKEFRTHAFELVEHINSDIYRKQTLGKIFNWAIFITENRRGIFTEIN
ncbi:restriction endonuclease [Paenibacillus lutimineralis]|uniref:Restriction endonuclease n=1 Tax=Paenibacillus lutimineralis TaxID=2707005 RepID=A0A3Q9I952_9BACL|nr:restriction endonuclease [Paenibacillus lutimineralis]AZS13978.1 restriction endonuclease [Paenibacillus lutimineralis]